MANGGKDVRLGDDKRPVSIIPNSEVNLFNISNGELLTDEFGTPLITNVDQFFTSDVSKNRATSVTFPKNPEDPYGRVIFSSVGTFSTVTYNVNFDVGINTAHVLQSGGSVVGFGTTVALATGTSLNGSSVQIAIGNTQFVQFPFLDIKTLTDQGTDQRNKLYFLDNVLNGSVQLRDKVEGPGIPDGSVVSKVYPSYLHLSNNVDADAVSGITTNILKIRRGTRRIAKANNVFKIEEQFKETSEVSSSLLGIPRAETQLSLFSNVSSYGLNNDDFEFFTFNGGLSFGSWDRRANSIYGSRYNASRSEEVQESAVKLEAFPVPFSFPFNSNFDQVGFFNQEKFNNFLKFVQLGNRLYNHFDGKAGYDNAWRDKFLNPETTFVDGNDVNYAAGITDSFAAIDTWTDTWRDIKDTTLTDPVSGTAFDFSAVNNLNLIGSPYSSDNTIPGYNSAFTRYSFLQSRRVFRYQPGRISGFTFGLRVSTEPQPGAIMEWGIRNPTDQYVFRMDSGRISIIRRSTIPLPGSALERSGLTTQDQTFIGTGDPFDDRQYWTIEVPRDKFNHDQLTGNGPSGYNIGPERVTMYKIEFGWYGAIGARFYAYIPAGPGEARWVKIHTFVIENSIGQPCLQDSFFRFSYSLNVSDSQLLREPVFLYKYGSSYYIDGGDEGTSRIHSVASKVKSINSISERTLIGVTPKDFILNSIGTPIKNKKLIIPTTLNITSDSLAQVEVVKCRACPGFGHVYTPGVASTVTGPEVTVRLTGSNTLTSQDGTSFKQSDLNSKIIAPSIWNAYITDLQDENPVGSGNFETATIKGFPGSNGYPTLSSRNYNVLVIDSVSGVTTTLASGPTVPNYGYPVRLSSQDNHYVASDFGFTGNKIEIQYLNPSQSDEFGHFADFSVGVTNYKPERGAGDALLGFNKPGVGVTTILKTKGNQTEVIFAEHTHSRPGLTEIGAEFKEVFSSSRLPCRTAIDFRIPQPPGDATGNCCRVTIEVLDATQVTSINQRTGSDMPAEANIPDADLTSIFLLKLGTFPSGIDFDGGQVKLTSELDPSAATYVGEVESFSANDEIFSFIKISQSLGSPGADFSIDIRPVKLTASENPTRQKLFNFDPFPLFFFAKLSDNAAINNITIKETSGGFQRTITPILYVLGDNIAVTNAGGQANVSGAPPTNFLEVTRLSSALTDIQNEQNLRPTTKIDTLYIGEDQTLEVDMSKIFGQDRNVITPDNQNIEATFLVGKKLSSGSGEIEATLNYKEQ
tara:strand:- start:313 stop:4071 length:3759 start_codon:yes stop_codon:yes gene_type:complete